MWGRGVSVGGWGEVGGEGGGGGTGNEDYRDPTGRKLS